jgi:predicted dehydrogenase
MMKKLNVGIVGLGTISQRLMDAVCNCEMLELAAVCHHKEERLKEVAVHWGVGKAYLNYSDMLADGDIGAVIIATPNYLHASMTMDALKAGKHVFCEKPPAMDEDEARQVRDCARQTGKLVMYGLMFRFSKKHALVKNLRDEGMFGDIFYAKAGIIRRCGDPGGWFSDKSLAGGGSLIDVGSHIIDLTVHLMGDYEPVSVFSRSFKNTENLDGVRAVSSYQAFSGGASKSDVEELDIVMVNFSNGACLVVETSTKSHIKEDRMYLEMQGSKGGIMADPEIEIYTVQHNCLMDMKPKINCGQFEYQEAINDEICHFADCVLNETQCISSVEEGCKLMRIISAAYQSQQEGRLVILQDEKE